LQSAWRLIGAAPALRKSLRGKAGRGWKACCRRRKRG